MVPSPTPVPDLAIAFDALATALKDQSDPIWPAAASGFIAAAAIWLIAEVVRGCSDRIDNLRVLVAEACTHGDMLDNQLRDLMHPDLDGDELARKLREFSTTMLSTGLCLLHARSVPDWMATCFGVASRTQRRRAARALSSLSWRMRLTLGNTRQEMLDSGRELLKTVAEMRTDLGCECLAATHDELSVEPERE